MSVNSILSQADAQLQSTTVQQLLEQQFKELAGARSSVASSDVERAAPNGMWSLSEHMRAAGLRMKRVQHKEARKLLKAFSTGVADELDHKEFVEYMQRLVKYATIKGRKGSGKRWALGIVLASAGAVAVAAGLPLVLPVLAGSGLAGAGLLAAGPIGAAVGAVAVAADSKRANAKACKLLSQQQPQAEAVLAEEEDVDVAALVCTAPNAPTAAPSEVAEAPAEAPEPVPQQAGDEPASQQPDETAAPPDVSADSKDEVQPAAEALKVEVEQEPEQGISIVLDSPAQSPLQSPAFAPDTPKGSPTAAQESSSESSALLTADAAAQLQRTATVDAAAAVDDDSELPVLPAAISPRLPQPAADAASEVSESGRSSKDARLSKWLQRTLSGNLKSKRLSDDARTSVDKSEGSLTEGATKLKGTDKMKDWLRRSVSLRSSRGSADADEGRV